MDAALRELLNQQVQFLPVAATSPHGDTTFGAATTAVACRWSWPSKQRRGSARGEDLDRPASVYIDGGSFDPAAVRVGSLVLTPDGQVDWPDGRRRVVSGIESHYVEGSTTIDHWKITVI